MDRMNKTKHKLQSIVNTNNLISKLHNILQPHTCLVDLTTWLMAVAYSLNHVGNKENQSIFPITQFLCPNHL